MAKTKEQPKSNTPRVHNRRARHDYHISEVVECGVALLGTEVKSLRAGQAKIDEAYARVRGGEVYLVGVNIAAYAQAGEAMQHDPTRDRKLLLRRRQIAELESHVRQKGNTLIPLTLYFKRGWAKCELGLAQGKRQHDKRESIRDREQKREIDRAMKGRNR